MSSYALTLGAGFVLGWLATLSLIVVGYLVSLQIRDIRRRRRLLAKRKMLELKYGREGAANYAFRPKFAAAERTTSSQGSPCSGPFPTWTIASIQDSHLTAVGCFTATLSDLVSDETRGAGYQGYRITVSCGARS